MLIKITFFVVRLLALLADKYHHVGQICFTNVFDLSDFVTPAVTGHYHQKSAPQKNQCRSKLIKSPLTGKSQEAMVDHPS